MSPAGRLNDPFYCTCWHRFLLFWDLFRLCHMKSEAFHFAKSFEHGPKASKQLNYIVFNDFIDISMSKIIIFQKNVENQFWLNYSCVKNCADFDGNVHFAWNLLKLWLFEDLQFICVHIFIFLLYFWVGGRAEPFKYHCFGAWKA